MKIRLLAIALIMAAVAPLTAQAQSGDFYGSARFGVEYDEELGLENFGSRFGYKGRSNIGNGLTASGQYELGINLEGAALNTRHAYVGLEGDFGKLTLGQTYHTFYQHVTKPTDQANWGSCNGCLPGTTDRSTALSYERDFDGAIRGGISLYLDNNDGFGDGEQLDGFEVAASFPVSDFSVGLGLRDIEGADGIIGATISGDFDAIPFAVAIMSQGDNLGVNLFTEYDDFYADVGTIQQDLGNDTLGFTLGYNKPLGSKATSWYELQWDDNGGVGDANIALRAAMKYDWN